MTPGLTFSSARPYPEEEELNPLAGPVGKLGGLGLRLCEYFGGEETEVGKETRDQDEIQVPDCTQDPFFFAARALPLPLEGLVCLSF